MDVVMVWLLRSNFASICFGCLGIDLLPSTKVKLEGLKGQARPEC